MTTLTVADVYQLARTAGLEPAAAATAVAIAISESGLRPDALGDVGIQTSKWGPSVGLWQIRSLKAETGRGTSRDASRLTDPTFNASAMVAISGGGKSWSPWSTFTSGAYRANLATVSAGSGDATSTSSTGATSTSSSDATSTGDAPWIGWQAKGLAVGLKLAIVGAGLTLITLGVWRLVLPGAAKVAGAAAAAIA